MENPLRGFFQKRRSLNISFTDFLVFERSFTAELLLTLHFVILTFFAFSRALFPVTILRRFVLSFGFAFAMPPHGICAAKTKYNEDKKAAEDADESFSKTLNDYIAEYPAGLIEVRPKDATDAINNYSSMAELTEAKGYKFGTCVTYNLIKNDPEFCKLLAHHCDSITVMNEFKAYSLLDYDASVAAYTDETSMPVMRYQKADEICEWARANNLKIRQNRGAQNLFYYHCSSKANGKGENYVKFTFDCAYDTREAMINEGLLSERSKIELVYNDYNVIEANKRPYIKKLVESLNSDPNRQICDSVGCQGYLGAYQKQQGCLTQDWVRQDNNNY